MIVYEAGCLYLKSDAKNRHEYSIIASIVFVSGKIYLYYQKIDHKLGQYSNLNIMVALPLFLQNYFI